MAKLRLSELHSKLNEDDQPKAPKTEKDKLDANPDRGQRSDFFKVTITMHPDMLAALKEFGLKRRRSGHKNTDTSSLIREAVAKLLSEGE